MVAKISRASWKPYTLLPSRDIAAPSPPPEPSKTWVPHSQPKDGLLLPYSLPSAGNPHADGLLTLHRCAFTTPVSTAACVSRS